ncbi:hypothetical protein NIES2107_53770 [Nostoc carneum NIES-2107]|nr:hypothetical protein NIES2107_53770 [Nostoc carneum NIES-2107]
MTNWIEISTDYSGKLGQSAVKKARWQPYLFLGIATNLVFWLSAFCYLKFTEPIYTSQSAINLPGSGSNANVNLPGIGNASYENSSPYSYSTSQDPRENYKFIAEGEAVLNKAATQLNMSLEEFGSPRIKLLDNTTIMEVEIQGKSPEEAQEKSIAFYRALEAELNKLRFQEANRRDIGFQAALKASQIKLQVAQQRLSTYKNISGLNSDVQIKELTINIEQLRKQHSEILAQEQQAKTREQQLSANLKVSASKATDAFVLQTDQIFQQTLKNYSEASANLVILESKFLPNHPTVVTEKAKLEAAQNALLVRTQVLLGRQISLENIQQLSLNTNNTNASPREEIFQELVKVQAEQKGLTSQAQKLYEEITQLEKRLKNLTQKESDLDGLKRDMQVAEAVFTSNLTRLDIGKTNAFGSYPFIQIITEPNLPDSPTQPKPAFVYLGATAGSLFTTAGVVLLWLRARHRRPKEY